MNIPLAPSDPALRRWLPPLALLAIAGLFFWKLALTNLILARGDTFLYFYPYWDYRAQALLAGRLPLWNPLLFMGAPFLANSQAGVLYPFNWPLAVFTAPVAVKLSLLFHLGVAVLGAYAFARRALGQSALGALLAGMLFALGGYVTAQVEHVNQLQGMAWLPWILLLVHRLVAQIALGAGHPGARHRSTPPPRPGRARLSLTLGLAILFALQLLAGHTQTLVISGMGAGLYAVVFSLAWFRAKPTTDDGRQTTDREGKPAIPARAILHTSTPPYLHTPTHPHTHTLTHVLFSLTAAALLTALLSAGQLLPTLELSAQSLRGGGLPWREAVSFSLDPRLVGRALLPGFSRALFSEFVAYGGVTALVLALLGWRRSPAGWALLALCAVGLAFALGAYNPLYAGLALVPPFNLFRVPARWLLLWAFGLAMLAGWGLETVGNGRLRLGRAWALVPPLGLMGASLLANGLVPAGETGPLGAPAAVDWAGWLAALALAAGLIWAPAPGWLRATGLAALVAAELFLAGRALPYNHLTAPSAYSSVRPAMTQLLLEACRAGQPPAEHCPGIEQTGVVPGRFLSLSALRFDPGDLAELRGALDSQLPPDAVFDYIVATKHKEVLSPNLPLAWNIAAVDGYDGGVLPLAHYAAFTQLFTGAPSSDGRLRENLTAAPYAWLLSLVGAKYLITDKVGDAWIDGVFYDLQFSLTLAAGEQAQVAHVPAFQATALGVVAEGGTPTVRVTFDDGQMLQATAQGGRVHFDAPATPVTITLEGPATVRGLSLIDERTGSFQTLALGPYRLVHSGDVKIYENLAVMPRAFVAAQSTVARYDGAAWALLVDPGFDPAQTVILAEPLRDLANSDVPRSAEITAYTPERITITAEGPGYLVLTDAFYPGWQARVDGEPVAILRANVMFRAVPLEAGTHEVEFVFRPWSVWAGMGVMAAAWVAVGVAAVVLRRKRG